MIQNIDLKAQKPAKRYAQAFFETIENKNYDKINNELNEFLEIYTKNFELKNFLMHPAIKKEDKKDVIKQAFGHFSVESINFLQILVDENRMDCLDEIQGFLIDKINGKNNTVLLDVILAIEPSIDIKNHIKERLERKLQSKVSVNFIKEESIIGGLIVKIKDTVIDLSISRKLENFRRI